MLVYLLVEDWTCFCTEKSNSCAQILFYLQVGCEKLVHSSVSELLLEAGALVHVPEVVFDFLREIGVFYKIWGVLR